MDKNLFYTQNQLLWQTKYKKCTVCDGAIIAVSDGVYKCSRCNKEYLDDFGKIKKYLNENGKTNIHTIARETGVPMQVIYDFLNNCKMEINQPSTAYLKCEICKTEITCGRICPTCGNYFTQKESKTISDKVKISQIGDKPRNFKTNVLPKKMVYNPNRNFETIKKLEEVFKQDKKFESKFVRDLHILKNNK